MLPRGATGVAPSGSSPVLGVDPDRGLSGSNWGRDASKLPGEGRAKEGISSMFRRCVCCVGIEPMLTSPFACLSAFWVCSQVRAVMSPGSECCDGVRSGLRGALL